ncbi:MAG: hypothetical protein K2J49_02710, partial [Muribaculaceae bacterium]|nr:hypothetical protein [Muribaculaceae bacterium]
LQRLQIFQTFEKFHVQFFYQKNLQKFCFNYNFALQIRKTPLPFWVFLLSELSLKAVSIIGEPSLQGRDLWATDSEK